ncbi:MAG: hypothetical protein VCE75_18735 [Alphaproteobacteria bacterium]
MTEIVTFSGHKINLPVLHTYVKPGREAAIRALNKLETNEKQNITFSRIAALRIKNSAV